MLLTADICRLTDGINFDHWLRVSARICVIKPVWATVLQALTWRACDHDKPRQLQSCLLLNHDTSKCNKESDHIPTELLFAQETEQLVRENLGLDYFHTFFNYLYLKNEVHKIIYTNRFAAFPSDKVKTNSFRICVINILFEDISFHRWVDIFVMDTIKLYSQVPS